MKITNLCPKSGKTTLSYQLFGKRGLILALEQGYSLLDGAMAININSYSDLNKVLKQLKDERVKSMYDVIIIDTVDVLHLLLEKHLCNTHGVSSINEVGAFGSGFAKLDSLVNDILLKITSYGYKLFIISHATPKKALINRITTSNQAFDVAQTLLPLPAGQILNQVQDDAVIRGVPC